MKIENPIAFSFIMPDELYLLATDRPTFKTDALPFAKLAPAVETPTINFNYFGQHKKRFLVIVHYPGHEFIDDKHLTALENILKRLDMTTADTAIFNRARHSDATYEQLADFFNPCKLLLLGKDALPPGMEAPALNQPNKVEDCAALFTYSFDEMMDNNDYKKAFWEQMKQL